MERLNEILHELGISKVKLAKFLGVSRQMIYNYLELDDINKWPKDKKVLLLNLLGIKSPEELNNIKVDTDYILSVENRLNSLVESEQSIHNAMDKSIYEGLGKSQKELFQNLIDIIKEKLDDEKEQVAGLLHDILEDTEITEDDLKNFGIPQDIIDIVKIVTKPVVDKTKLNEEERLKLYDEEINKIIATNNIHAIRLKYADMTDNFNPNRINKLPKEKQEWFNKKYGPQLVKLKTKKEGDYYDRY